MRVRAGFIAFVIGALVGVVSPASAISTSPATIDFGAVAVGQTKTKTVTVKLDAGYALSSVTGTGTTLPYNVGLGTCAAAVGTFGVKSCKLNVSFTPSMRLVTSARLDITECPVTGTCAVTTLALTGRGGLTTPSPDPVAFGNVAVGTSKTQTLTLALEPGWRVVEKIGGALLPPWTLDPGTCVNGFSGSNCKMNLMVTPTRPGPLREFLGVNVCSADLRTCTEIDYVVTAVGGPTAIKPADFGTVKVGKSKAKTITVKLDRTSFVGSLFTSGSDEFTLTSTTCTDEAGTASCKVVVTLTPTQLGTLATGLYVDVCPNNGGCFATFTPITGRSGV